MPQIIVKGLDEKQMMTLAKTTSNTLGSICACDANWFVFESTNAYFINSDGEKFNQAVVQVHWFKRSQEIQDKVAGLLDKAIKDMGFDFTQISFHLFYEEAYYEDGEHF